MNALRWLAVLSCAASSACGGSRGAPSANAPSSATEGVYDFSANIPGEQLGSTIRVRGSFAIAGDSLVIHPDSNCSLADPETTARMASSYRATVGPGISSLSCRGGARLTFDRRNPTGAQWFAVVRVPKQRNACAEYTRRETREVCVRYRPETYYEMQQRSGGVQVKLIP